MAERLRGAASAGTSKTLRWEMFARRNDVANAGRARPDTIVRLATDSAGATRAGTRNAIGHAFEAARSPPACPTLISLEIIRTKF
jgi:hypothetical protein